ncbi:hypothetical protein O6H91_20G031800 [Diphasiastrum complanatum]|uniref:Uncharacterized protein n=1 Tax=Diphasiastrum complanatum TaxID=34168 RepID=A0ACC2AP40_DIPCM|nr:hypothetical protein O6H91_20G031800 [Diphasiastrum complanatum]
MLDVFDRLKKALYPSKICSWHWNPTLIKDIRIRLLDTHGQVYFRVHVAVEHDRCCSPTNNLQILPALFWRYRGREFTQQKKPDSFCGLVKRFFLKTPLFHGLKSYQGNTPSIKPMGFMGIMPCCC